jgi:hypothetical protein
MTAFRGLTYLSPYTKSRDGKCTPTFKTSLLASALGAWPSTRSMPSTSSLVVIPAIIIPHRFRTTWPLRRRHAPSRQLGSAARCKYVSTRAEPYVCMPLRDSLCRPSRACWRSYRSYRSLSITLTRSPEIKFVMTTPTRGGPVKMVYAVPIVPLILSLKPMKAGLIVVFCLYFGYLPIFLEFVKALAQELGESSVQQ